MEAGAAAPAPAAIRNKPRALDCPVCPRSEIPGDAAACPSCGADLMPIRRVRELPQWWVNQALELAGRGEVERAVERLAAALALGGDRASIGLLAGKLLWRAGRREEAHRQWAAVLREYPEQAEAASLMEMAGAEHAVARAPHWLFLAVCALSALLIASLVWFAAYRSTHHHSDPEFASLSNRTAQAVDVKPSAGPAKTLAEALRAQPDFEVAEESGHLLVLFREGLFGPGSERIAGDAARRLALLASLLARHGAGASVVVEGLTDSSTPSGSGRWKDNATLALARANAVAACLREHSQGAPLRWMGVAAGESGRSSRLKNADSARSRTAVLYVFIDSQPGT